jgi:hypothetical protein
VPKITDVQGLGLDALCHVVLIEGSFNPPLRPHLGPPEAERRSLSSIVLIVNVETNRVVGSHRVFTGGATPDLSQLGPVTLDASATTALADWSPRRSAADDEALRNPLASAGHRGDPRKPPR